MSESATDQVTRPLTIEDLAQQFVELVRELPFVDLVLIEESGSGATIWTIIDAEPSDWSFQEQVYGAELKVQQDHIGVDVGFRLINIQEMRDLQVTWYPTRSRVLWERRR